MRQSRSTNRIRRRLVPTLALSVALLISAPAHGGETWLTEDFSGDPTAVFDGTHWGFRSTGDGHVGPGLEVPIPQGDNWGSWGDILLEPRLGAEPEELYWRYWIRFPSGFEFADGARGKLPGPANLNGDGCNGGDVSTSGHPCWSARMLMTPLYRNDGLPSYQVDTSTVTRVGSYVYDLADDDRGRRRIIPWDADVATLEHGRWHCIEGRLELNTPGVSDGVLQGWVNGEAAYDERDLRLRRAGEGGLDIESFWFNVYHGGSDPSPRDNHVRFDSLALGPERLGCDDADGSYTGTFADDDDSIFEPDIERLAASGITKGCSDTRFCPDERVTRGQMAAFLHRALADRYPTKPVEPPPSPPSLFGARSHLSYLDAIGAFADAAAPLDTFIVTYPIDRGGSQDWLAPDGPHDPKHWVPKQLENIWQEGVTPYVRVTVDDFDGLLTGAHDQRVANMLDAFAEFTSAGGGRQLLVDILPSANKAALDHGDRPAEFISVYRDLASQARETIGADAVRTVFTMERVMTSDRYSAADHGLGGYSLFFPGVDHVDLVGIVDEVEAAADPPSVRQHFNAAVEEMAAVAGPELPIVIAATGIDASTADQAAWLADGAAWIDDHPQVMGLQYEDVEYAFADLRVTDGGAVPSSVAEAARGLTDGGDDWLWSPGYPEWQAERASLRTFADTTGHTFEADIRWLATTGITRGCDDTRFCPDDPVTRGQMAAFLVRALGLPAPDTPITFADTTGHTFEADIARLAAAGITKGCDDTRFCPDDAVTRGQMAAFLVRAGLTD